MKNATMTTIYNALTNYNYDNAEVMAELYNEIHRNDAEKAARGAEYDAAHDTIMEAIRVAGAPVSVADIFEEAKESLPEGFTKNKVSYGLRTYWGDEVVVTKGKVNMYALKDA